MLWIESKMLALRIGHRPIAAAGLRVLLPGGYEGAPLQIFRGASSLERRRKLYGFSWTARIEEARRFAEHWRKSEHGGCVLATMAPPNAVLLVREEEDYYDEAEVVIDPFKLGPVTVLERIPGRVADQI